ncbi:ribonucleotide reductase [Mycena metata]|uniref:Ribonucleoside-diphosphate reductase n=1 Tax=Mycena metata TaxID=1033252 RepID=A0AAD7MU48_9AGAR|nr:ribonucleotide reductase [Mycena metata]
MSRLVDAVDVELESLENKWVTGITSQNIEEIAIQAALRSAPVSYAYIWIAAHLEVSQMHKSLHPSFSKGIEAARDSAGKHLLQDELRNVVADHREALDEAVVHLKDFDHTYDMIRDMQARYILRNGSALIERVQNMFMRVAVAIHMDDLPGVLATYGLLSARKIILDPFAYLNAGSSSKPASSTTALSFMDAGVDGAYDVIAKCVLAVRSGGRVALSAHDIPCAGKEGACRHPDRNIGLWPMMRLLDGAIGVAREPGDRRTDVVNVCVEPWHVDVLGLLEFLVLHRNGVSDQKSITVTLSVPDIFMVRVEEDGPWSLFCPADTPGLLDLCGESFEEAYIRYETSGVRRTPISARALWDTIIGAILSTDGPTIIYKDSTNDKSNVPMLRGARHADLRNGMINTTGVGNFLASRNHASIALPLLVTRSGTFDFGQLRDAVHQATIILNKLLDAGVAADQDREFRAIAIGVHGLADVFAAIRMPYDSMEASSLNIRIAETVYYAALEASCDLAELHGPYPAFQQSPMAKGRYQFDLWNTQPSRHFNWDTLKAKIARFGVRNSVLTSVAPGNCLDSFSGYTDSVEPPSSNILAEGIVCPWLVRELQDAGLWSDVMKDAITKENGSIQAIDAIPADTKSIYRTAWEIDPETIVRMALDRAPFVCQNDSLSFHLESPTANRVGELLMRTWAAGLKTGAHAIYTRYTAHSSKETSSCEDDDGEMSFDELLSGSS